MNPPLRSDPLPIGAARLARPERWAVAAGVVLMLGLYFWTATDGHISFGSRPPQKNLYNMQVEAFAAGQLSLLDAPSPELLTAQNPYDPEVNEGTRLLDASFYRGRYYTYFGLVPIVLWLWPYYAVAGHHPPDDLTVLLFASLALLFQVLTITTLAANSTVRRRWTWTPLAVLVAGTCNLLQPLLRHQSFFDIAVVSGLAFLSAAIWCLTHYLLGRPSRRWLAGSSLALGLAAGCRPNLLPLVALPLLAGLMQEWWRQRPALVRLLRVCGWAVAPGALVVAGMFAYNAARFGNPLEFGFRYQLIGTDLLRHPPFNAAFVPYNLFYYLLEPFRVSPFFPFFLESAHVLTPPVTHDLAIDRVVGWLVGYPILPVGCLIWILAVARGRQWTGRVAWTVLLGLIFAGVFALFTVFPGVAVRYQAEATLPLVLGAAAGVLVLGSGEVARRPITRRLAIVAVTAAFLGSAILNFLIAAATDDWWKQQNPAQYSAVRQAMDLPVYALMKLVGWHPKAVRIDLNFPPDKLGSLEPIWVHGVPPTADFLYVYYVAPNRVQFGFESMGRGGPVSEPIPADYGVPHRLDLVAGGLLPPSGYLYYSDIGWGDGLALTHLLRLTLDGRPVIDAWVDYHDHDGKELQAWGISREETAFGRRFTGREFRVRPMAFDPQAVADLRQPSAYGDVVLRLRWPASARAGAQPLVAVGAKNRGWLVYARWDGLEQLRLGLSNGVGQASESEPVDWNPQAEVLLAVRLPDLYPPPTLTSLPWPNRIPEGGEIILDGRIILKAPTPRAGAAPRAVVTGRNTLLISGVDESFGGRILAVTRRWPPEQ